MKKIAFVIPAYNEEQNIPIIYREISLIIKKIAKKYSGEIVFIDDGSKDESWQKIRELARQDKRVKGASFSRNFGHQVALEAGISNTDADAVIMIDCDGQHPVELSLKMIEKWECGALIVNAIRRDTKGSSYFKKATSKMFYNFLNKSSETKIEPGSADFRLIDKKIVNILKEFPEKAKFYRGLINWIGFEPVNLEYVANERWGGKSSYTFIRMYKLATNGLTGFSNFPLRIAKYIGLITFSFGIIGLLGMIITAMATNIYFPVWLYLIVFLLLLSGLQFIVLWFIGSYIGLIYNQQKERPSYIIRDGMNL